MNGLDRDDIIRIYMQVSDELCGGTEWCWAGVGEPLQRFANLVAAAEREKVAQWMMQRGYATGHGDTIEDLLAELDWQIAENWNRAMINGMKTEREACAKEISAEINDEIEDEAYCILVALLARIRARREQ